MSVLNNISVAQLKKRHTPSRNAVPLFRQSSASILVAFNASSILAPEATTAQTIAPAEEPANGVVSCIGICILVMNAKA